MDYARYLKTMEDTFPSKLSGMDLPTMEACHCFLVDIQPEMTRMDQIRPLADRIDLLRREIELKRIEEKNAIRHAETSQIGRKTLCWAIVAGIGTIGLLLLEIPFSKLLPAKASQSPPLSQTTAPPVETPAATESPSISPTAPPTPAVEATPE